jgi:acyl carrier protein
MPENTLARVQTIIQELLGFDKESLSPEATLSDLGFDSLDIVDLALALEDEFDIEVSDEEAGSFKTVEDIVAFVNSRA